MKRIVSVALVVLGLAISGTAAFADGTVVGGPYKTDPAASTEHGNLVENGTAIVLNQFNPDWPGDHFCNLIVKGGPNGQTEVADPTPGTVYFTPGLNPAGQHYEVSHWTVSKCEDETPEETTTTPVVNTVVETTADTVEDTTTTAEATTSTVAETTSTEAAATTVVQTVPPTAVLGIDITAETTVGSTLPATGAREIAMQLGIASLFLFSGLWTLLKVRRPNEA